MTNVDEYKFQTPTRHIEVQKYSHIFVKDESVNPTGTHKDRMAFEIAKFYSQQIKYSQFSQNALPACSIISAGNAAMAIGSVFAKFGLPKLKVLMDRTIGIDIRRILNENHCEIYTAPIFNNVLTAEQILEYTNNIDGIELTSFSVYNSDILFYRELAKEILADEPDVIIVPYGSGVLFQNICAAIYALNCNIKSTKRVLCDVIGVTTSNPKSKANKLYSAYSPFDYNRIFLQFLKKFAFIGQKSNIVSFNEISLDRAQSIFANKNINVEASSAAGLAYLLDAQEYLDKRQKYIIVSTGLGTLEQLLQKNNLDNTMVKVCEQI